MTTNAKSNHIRLRYFIALLVLLAVEVVIALFVHDRFIRPYVGDIIVVAVVYCCFRILIPRGAPLMPLYATAFAVLVEILQLFNIADLMGLGADSALRIIIGSTYDFIDIVCYCIGGVLITGTEYALHRLREAKRESAK